MTYLRLLYILSILAHYRLDTFVKNAKLVWLIRLFVLLDPLSWFQNKQQSRGIRLTKALIKLGPIFVKFGQVLSTRPDILPKDIVKELIRLQDRVPAFSSKKVVALLTEAYNKPIDQVFKHFDNEPLASASVAQVHAATLYDDSDVVVKIVRPNIRGTIQNDLKILHLLAKIGTKVLANAEYLHLPEIVNEFETTILNELDMRLEAENATRLRNNFDDSDLLYVPKIYWPYVRNNVLVMERIYGVRISDIDILKSKKANFKKLAEDGVEIFYTQVFRDQFFHADMHSGNILVNVDDPENPIYCGIDFGIMGTLTDQDKYYMGENFLAFFNNDYRRVAELHIESGWVPKDTSIPAFEQALKATFGPMFNKSISETSFGNVFTELLKVAQVFNMHVQPQLVLLQKTLLNVEGLGRQLYPELNLWETAKPHLERIMGKKISLKMRLGLLKAQWRNLSFDLTALPKTIEKILNVIN